jgi:hypothetical protein
MVQYLGYRDLLDLTLFDFFLWGLMKEMMYSVKVHTREELCIGFWMLLLTYENTPE